MKRKNIAIVIGCLLSSLSFTSVANSQTQYFNQNDFPSDTVGDLPASVMLVQSTIMPSKHGVTGDVQPHLVSDRTMMVLFQPKEDLKNDVAVTVKDAQGTVIYQQKMNAPDQLPKIAGQTDYTGSIVKPSNFDKVINDNATLSNFNNDDDAAYFSKLFSSYKTINIQTRDGNWAKEFHLPNGKNYSGKKVTFTSNAGYSSTVYYSSGSLTLRKGEEFTLQNIDGVWYSDSDGGFNQIAYSENTYSVVIPAAIVKPGLTFSFTAGNKEGELNGVTVGAPNELIIHTVDIGMLTSPRGQYDFQDDTELHQEYFQQIPVSRLTVSEYEPQYFKEVMLPSGQLLTDFDPSFGTVYKGTMREKIAKLLVSHGIDLANYGISSSGGTTEKWHTYTAAQITAHHSVGYYSNGVVAHGLSGGNGMVTLFGSDGNEFSHELGHNFGLGHYPGGFVGAINRPADSVNSTWGWDSRNNYFLPNFEKEITNEDKCYDNQCQPSFLGHRFGAGAMSGGAPLYSDFNRYTLHTPYELNKIQNYFESKAVFSPSSSSGFKKWDSDLKEMVIWHNLVKNDLEGSSSKTVEQKPYKQGVAVATLVGYYDPDQKLDSYIYPALHGSFGAVYNDALSNSSCQLNVYTEKGGTKVFNLYTRRLDSGNMNKFHVNVETSLKPYMAEVYCDGNLLATRQLDEPKKDLTTSIITTETAEQEPKGCIVSIESGEKYCLQIGERSGYALPSSFHNKPVYVYAEPGTSVILSDFDNLSYNHIASFVGTVKHEDLKNVKAKNGEFLDFSHPKSMRVKASN